MDCLDDAVDNGYSFSVPAGDGVPNRLFGD
jgi:hypothetical protein